jgi:hypothetical protein
MMPRKEELALSVDEAQWDWLRAHLNRGGLILVDNSLDLTEAAISVANDDTNSLEKWISSGHVSKPTESLIQAWDADKQKRFSMLIISPYILIQERLPTFH